MEEHIYQGVVESQKTQRRRETEEGMRKHPSITRRSLLLGSAACATIILAGPTLHVTGTAYGNDVQYGFLVDLSKCVNCKKCVAACRAANELSDDTPDRRVVRAYYDERGYKTTVSTSCMHCAEPSCQTVCPAGAITKGEGGIVDVNKERCIGCKYCYQACPYEVPHYNAAGMDKCDCCIHAGVEVGDTPHCVQACLFDALHYGTLDDLKAAAPDARVIAEANNPSCLVVS